MLRLVLLCALAALSGCGTDQNDLKKFVRESDKVAERKVDTLPAAKPVEPFVYEGFDLPDPFKPRKITAKEGSGGGLSPDLNRRKEPLEAYPLEQLKLVGTIEQNNRLYAIFRADKTLYRVTRGNFIGNNFGLITDVTAEGVRIKEIVQDGAGDWAERESILPMGELTEPQVVVKASDPIQGQVAPYLDRVVPILFATNRRKSGVNQPDSYFLDEEAGGSTGTRTVVTLGRAIVRVPPKHAKGVLEQPGWIRLTLEKAQPSTLLELMNVPKFSAEDPERHFTFAGPIEELTAAAFLRDLKTSLRASKSRSAVLFIHGYANSFKDAAYRSAQLCYDLQLEKYDAVPLLFSWPSDPGGYNYLAAKDRIRSAGTHLATFLKDVMNATGVGVVHIVAHSMGADVLTVALEQLGDSNLVVRGRNKQPVPRLHQIVLAAPDIRADTFQDVIAPAVKSRHRVTNYASSNDAALRWSRKGNVDARAGDTSHGLVAVEGVDTIDASSVNSELLGHSYFAESPAMIRDLTMLLRDGKKPEARGLTPVRRQEWKYWQFP